jgi:hypothetical protein
LPPGLLWIEDLVSAPEPFSYAWPAKKGQKPSIEVYPNVLKGQISLHGRRFGVTVGEGKREVGVGKGRREVRVRVTVFFDTSPIAEFVDTQDGNGLASLIKPDSRKTLRIGEPPPSLYKHGRLEPYREVTGIAGSGAPNAIAVIIHRNDYKSAVHQAAARWLSRKDHEVESAI